MGGLSHLVQQGEDRAVSNVTAHPSTASVPTSYYLMWQFPLDSKGLNKDTNTRGNY